MGQDAYGSVPSRLKCLCTPFRALCMEHKPSTSGASSRFFWTPIREGYHSPAGLWGRRMKHLEEYAEHAKECRAMAAKALLPEIRAHLLEMADRWEELARQRAVHMHLEDVLA